MMNCVRGTDRTGLGCLGRQQLVDDVSLHGRLVEHCLTRLWLGATWVRGSSWRERGRRWHSLPELPYLSADNVWALGRDRHRAAHPLQHRPTHEGGNFESRDSPDI